MKTYIVKEVPCQSINGQRCYTTTSIRNIVRWWNDKNLEERALLSERYYPNENMHKLTSKQICIIHEKEYPSN